MYQQAFKYITEAINNWPAADVRTVPGVMYHIRCGADENDPDVEYQLNSFIDVEETYVHNHRHSFDTLCLEGEYLEKLWEIIDENSGSIIYQFCRKPGNIFDIPREIPGTLCHVKSRRHYLGNQMHVGIEQYHSISPVGSDSRVFTFLKKRKHSTTSDMYVLSSSPTIDAPNDEIRPATEEERQIMYNTLLHILQTKSPQNSPLFL